MVTLAVLGWKELFVQDQRSRPVDNQVAHFVSMRNCVMPDGVALQWRVDLPQRPSLPKRSSERLREATVFADTYSRS